MTPIEREKRTLIKMVRIYCQKHHAPTSRGLCIDCNILIDYAFDRLEKCPEGNRKPSCRKCVRHCYTPSRRSQIATVMRFSGPYMAYRHPLCTLRHILKELRNNPKRPVNKSTDNI